MAATTNEEKKAADAERKRAERAAKKKAETEAAKRKAAEEERARRAKAAEAKAKAMEERAAERKAADEKEMADFETPTPEQADAFRQWCLRNSCTPQSEREARRLFMQWKKTHAVDMSAEDAAKAAKGVKKWTAIHTCGYYDERGKKHKVKAGETVSDICAGDAAALSRGGHLEPYQEPSKLGINPAAATG